MTLYYNSLPLPLCKCKGHSTVTVLLSDHLIRSCMWRRENQHRASHIVRQGSCHYACHLSFLTVGSASIGLSGLKESFFLAPQTATYCRSHISSTLMRKNKCTYTRAAAVADSFHCSTTCACVCVSLFQVITSLGVSREVLARRTYIHVRQREIGSGCNRVCMYDMYTCMIPTILLPVTMSHWSHYMQYNGLQCMRIRTYIAHTSSQGQYNILQTKYY